MATKYEPAYGPAKIAAGLITDHHRNLIDAPIVYVFISPAPKAHGRVILGRARKVSGLNAFLVALAAGEVNPLEEVGAEIDEEEDEVDHSFFVMEISWNEWRRASAEERAALVDHELCHFAVDEEGALSIRGHDLEEFTAVVLRHGLWREDVQRFAGACSSVAT